MTKEELFATIQRAGMTPVPITQEGDSDETICYFAGSLNPFLVTAKAIGATAMFVQETVLEDWDFLYNPGEDEEEEADEDEGEPENEIDLAALSPDLAQYKKYLDTTYAFFLTAKGGVDDLWLVIEQDWTKDFENEVERAQGMALLARKPKSKR